MNQEYLRELLLIQRIELLEKRVAELERHPAVSIPPLRVVYGPFRPSSTADVK